MQNALSIDGIDKRSSLLSTFYSTPNFLYEHTIKQKQNYLLWAPIFLSIGIGLYFSLALELPALLPVFFLTITSVIYVFLKDTPTSLTHHTIKLIVTALLLISLGFTTAKMRTDLVMTPILEKKIKTTQLSGIIRSIEKLEKGKSSRIILSDLDIEDLSDEKTPKKVRLRIHKDQNIEVGQYVNLLVGLNPPSGPLIPGGFDFRRYLFFQQIGAVGFVYNEPEILEVKVDQNKNVEHLRHKIAAYFHEKLPQNTAAIASALIVGQKNAIADDDRQAIRDAGLAHMLAISGLHIGLFSGILFFILRFIMACIPNLALSYPIKKIAAVGALTGASFYMVLAGMTVPTQRAVIMSAIVFLAIILDRSPISLRMVAVAAFVILLMLPENILSVSFQMSFAAVTCLIHFYDITRNLWTNLYTNSNWIKKILLYFMSVCITTIIASIATAPFALYHFNQVSFIGSIANLIAVPLLAFIIMPFAILSLCLMPFDLANASINVMGGGIQSMLDISYWAASLPYAIIRMPAWPFMSFILLICASLWIIVWKGTGKLLAIPLFFFAIVTTQQLKMPDILISASHKLFLFKDQDGTLKTSTRRSDRFVLENWEKLYGVPLKSASLLPYKGELLNENNCGETGCRFIQNKYRISYVRYPYILKEECAWADLVISVEPVQKSACAAPHIIDKFDTYRSGTHAIYLEDSDVVIHTSIDKNIQRPWSPNHKDKY